MVNEIDIQQSAELLVACFGELARARAEERAEVCKSCGDTEAWNKWLRIAKTIEEMQRVAPGEAKN